MVTILLLHLLLVVPHLSLHHHQRLVVLRLLQHGVEMLVPLQHQVGRVMQWSQNMKGLCQRWVGDGQEGGHQLGEACVDVSNSVIGISTILSDVSNF